MPRLRLPTLLAGFLTLAACAAPRAAAPTPAALDTIAPPVAVPPVAARLADGASAAGVGFARPMADDEVEALLARYGARPYAVFLVVGDAPGFHEVPIDSARAGLTAEARRAKAAGTGTFPCFLQARLRQMEAAERGVRPVPGAPDERGRMMLTRLEAARTAGERLRRGDPAVYGVKVVGREEDLSRLAADPAVRQFLPAQRVSAGGGGEDVSVPGPDAPPWLQRPGPSPEVARLSNEEVRARVEALVADPLPGCEEELRNIEPREVAQRPEVRADGGVAAEGLVFRAGSRLLPRDEVAGTPAAGSVETVVTVTNSGTAPVRAEVRGCTVLLRAYRSPERTGEPAWDESRGIGCAQDRMALTLGAGESRDFPHRVDASRILGPGRPPGRYHFTALFRLGERTLELPAGEAELSYALEGLAYRARTEAAGGELRARATAVNTSARPIPLELGTCALRLRAYRTAERTGAPAWRSEARQPWEGGHFHACDLSLLVLTLAPGDSLGRFQLDVPVVEVLGDSLPDGRYHFTAVLELNFGETEEIPAGSAELSVARRPLPAERTAAGARYRAAAPAVVGPGRVRTRVTATLAGSGSDMVRYSYDCPVVLYAYRSRARRDAAPLSGEPEWRSHAACGTDQQRLTLAQGQEHVFEVEGSGLPAGRWYFAAVVNTPGRRVFLSAGDAEVR